MSRMDPTTTRVTRWLNHRSSHEDDVLLPPSALYPFLSFFLFPTLWTFTVLVVLTDDRLCPDCLSARRISSHFTVNPSPKEKKQKKTTKKPVGGKHKRRKNVGTIDKRRPVPCVKRVRRRRGRQQRAGSQGDKAGYHRRLPVPGSHSKGFKCVRVFGFSLVLSRAKDENINKKGKAAASERERIKRQGVANCPHPLPLSTPPIFLTDHHRYSIHSFSLSPGPLLSPAHHQVHKHKTQSTATHTHTHSTPLV